MAGLSQLSSAQKFLLAISLPITLVFLYFLFRKNEDEDEELTSRVVTSRHATLEVLVPRHAVGAVIGPQGVVIKQIQENTKTRINFKGESKADEDRVMVIRGTQDAIHQAELVVRKLIVDQPPIVSDIVLVPHTAVGRIIGRNGDTIRALTRQSKAKITIERNEARHSACPVSVYLKGPPAAVETAKLLILEKVAEDDEFRAKDAKESVRKLQEETTLLPRETTKQEDSEYHMVYVSSVEHPGHFWVQLLNTQSMELDQLLTDMTEFYGCQNMGQHLSEFDVGDMVAAPFEGDHRWYRAQVAQVTDDQVDLYYVDYGDSCFMSKRSVRALRDDFLSRLPFQAVECCLANVKPANGREWNGEAIDAFEALCHVGKWQAIMCKTVGHRNTDYGVSLLCVYLVDSVNGPKDVDVGAELVGLSHAVYAPLDTFHDQVII